MIGIIMIYNVINCDRDIYDLNDSCYKIIYSTTDKKLAEKLVAEFNSFESDFKNTNEDCFIEEVETDYLQDPIVSEIYTFQIYDDLPDYYIFRHTNVTITEKNSLQKSKSDNKTIFRVEADSEQEALYKLCYHLDKKLKSAQAYYQWIEDSETGELLKGKRTRIKTETFVEEK